MGVMCRTYSLYPMSRLAKAETKRTQDGHCMKSACQINFFSGFVGSLVVRLSLFRSSPVPGVTISLAAIPLFSLAATE